ICSAHGGRHFPRGSVAGDIRNLFDLLDTTGFPPDVAYLILGDIVNKGKNSIEVVCLLFCYKVLFPGRVFILRGEQETDNMLRKGGFKTEVMYRFDKELYKQFVSSFAYMPLASVIANKIYACHGGINNEVVRVNHIRHIERPLKTLTGPAAGIVLGVPINRMGSSYVNDQLLEYDTSMVFQFLEANKLDLIIRTGEWTPDGFRYVGNRTVLNIFSTRNYCNRGNPASMVKIDRNGKLDLILCSEEIEFDCLSTSAAQGRRVKKVSNIRK
ncbi:serine/threonine-protein phosphatase PP1 isozyme 1-like, partial [Tropilaelaps mercedesae]